MNTVYKKIILAILVPMAIGIVSIVGCKKEEIQCVEPVPVTEICMNTNIINAPFLTKIGCSNTLYTDSIITMEIIGIDDQRAYGFVCSASTGGGAKIFIESTYNDDVTLDTLIWPGCDGSSEYDITNPNLPSLLVEPYQIKMMKMYPLSEEIQQPPVEDSMYNFKFVILN